jgi:hypothetical protein
MSGTPEKGAPREPTQVVWDVIRTRDDLSRRTAEDRESSCPTFRSRFTASDISDDTSR